MRNTRTKIENTPVSSGWYGIVSGDGECEIWVGAAYWDGTWDRNTTRAFVRSTEPFSTKEEALEWASAQPD